MSFSGGGMIRITVTGLKEIEASLNGIKAELPNTKRKIIQEGTTLFFKTAFKNVHTITHKTQNSIHIDLMNEQMGIISAGFGMPFEEKRGGTRLDVGTPHKTFSTTAMTTATAMPEIIKRNIDALLNRHKTR